MDERPVQCEFFVPIVRNSDNQPHQPTAWAVLGDEIRRAFPAGHSGPETFYRGDALLMPKQVQLSEPHVYETITGGKIPLAGFSEAELAFLDMVAKKYSPRQDWTRFAAWWNAKFNASGLPTESVAYRVCQDLEARLGISQGKVSPPDYRDYLAELIDTQFGSRKDFCRVTGVDPGQLSRVLSNRDNLSMKVLLQVLKVLDAQLVIQTQQNSHEQTSVARAADALIAATKPSCDRPDPNKGPAPACSGEISLLTTGDSSLVRPT